MDRGGKLWVYAPPGCAMMPAMTNPNDHGADSSPSSWSRFRRHHQEYATLGLALDISRINFKDNFFESSKRAIQLAFGAMAELEKGGIANPDENRMVGHYWLRKPSLAPTQTIQDEILELRQSITTFTDKVHRGEIHGTAGEAFKHVLVIGIGGSALGPQFVSHGLGNSSDRMILHFLDNTDPDGFDRVFAELQGNLARTLVIVISKSGGTKETRNGMLEAEAAFASVGLQFGAHAVAVTGNGSALHNFASEHRWLRTFPMWDWVGGRTSVTSAVGLLPACLQGIDIEALLAGAEACDEVTRQPDSFRNPAALLALMWHAAGNGRGEKDMVILPYKDRLELFSRYLQQLVMESLGKETDLNGNIVHQGLAVYGNKGSTDQHAYIQQLRDGLHNFFVTFIEVLSDRSGESIEVDPGVTSGDYLNGFFLGTREALSQNGRESITITIQDVSAFSVGVLIALYERAVGFYASLIQVNAYHQPGVEAGKKAAENVIRTKHAIREFLGSRPGGRYDVEAIVKELNIPGEEELVFKICEHLSANPTRRIRKHYGSNAFNATYEAVSENADE